MFAEWTSIDMSLLMYQTWWQLISYSRMSSLLGLNAFGVHGSFPWSLEIGNKQWQCYSYKPDSPRGGHSAREPKKCLFGWTPVHWNLGRDGKYRQSLFIDVCPSPWAWHLNQCGVSRDMELALNIKLFDYSGSKGFSVSLLVFGKRCVCVYVCMCVYIQNPIISPWNLHRVLADSVLEFLRSILSIHRSDTPSSSVECLGAISGAPGLCPRFARVPC